MKRFMGFLLILRALTPILAIATIVWGARQVVGDFQAALGPPLRQMQADVADIGTTLDTARGQFERAFSALGTGVESAVAHLRSFRLPVFTSEQFGILFGALAEQFNNLFRGIEGVFQPLGDVMEGVDSILSSAEAIADGLGRAVRQGGEIFSRLRQVAVQWGQMLTVAVIFVGALAALSLLLPLVADFRRGWAMLFRRPTTREVLGSIFDALFIIIILLIILIILLLRNPATVVSNGDGGSGSGGGVDVTATFTATPTASITTTPSPTSTDTPTPSLTPTNTPTPASTYTHTSTATRTSTPTLTRTPTRTPSVTPIGTGSVCTRFDLEEGRDALNGVPAEGRFEMRETTGGLVATWTTRRGEVDSGWIRGLEISRESVWVTVTFHPADSGLPVSMEILNPAAGTSYGWLARGVCHAVELQFPD